MQASDLKPAKFFAQNYGIKSIIYGQAGTGKTPILNTAPKPLLLVTEPGMLSMKHSLIPTYPAFTVDKIEDFFRWFFSSNETKNFDTIGVDSVSQLCEIYLADAQNHNKHGQAAYGEMSKRVMEKLNGLYYFPQKHTYLICKEQMLEIQGVQTKRPYFPGRDLPVKIPHMFDEIIHLGIHNVPSMGQVKSFQCNGTFDITARDRTGMLDQFEPPDFGALVRKCMS